MAIPELRGNDSYKTNFESVSNGEIEGNGLHHGAQYLWVKCPKATVYVSGSLYRKDSNGYWALVQVDMSVDDPETKDIENVIRFELIKPDKTPFDKGEYKLKVVADGVNSWTDEFIIGD